MHNTLPCWISDQINKVMHYNATDQCYKEWACTAELNAAKRISKKMQEDIVQKAVEYLGVASCAKDDFCHTFTNILKESHVPRNIKRNALLSQTAAFFRMIGKKVASSRFRVTGKKGFCILRVQTMELGWERDGKTSMETLFRDACTPRRNRLNC